MHKHGHLPEFQAHHFPELNLTTSLLFWLSETSSSYFSLCVCGSSLSRSADSVWYQSLHYLLVPAPGWDWEAGRARGSGLCSHLFRPVPWSGLDFLRPGASHRHAAACSCSTGQVAAQQLWTKARHKNPAVNSTQSGWGFSLHWTVKIQPCSYTEWTVLTLTLTRTKTDI